MILEIEKVVILKDFFLGEIYSSKRYRLKLAFRLACATWGLLCVVLLNVYSGTLVSYMTSRQMESTPESVWGILDQGAISFLMVSTALGIELITVCAIRP